jgi:hypothetical protein
MGMDEERTKYARLDEKNLQLRSKAAASRSLCNRNSKAGQWAQGQAQGRAGQGQAGYFHSQLREFPIAGLPRHFV